VQRLCHRLLSAIYWLLHLLPPELEWLLSEQGAVKTSLEEDPRKKRQVRDMLSDAVKRSYRDAEDSDDDSD